MEFYCKIDFPSPPPTLLFYFSILKLIHVFLLFILCVMFPLLSLFISLKSSYIWPGRALPAHCCVLLTYPYHLRAFSYFVDNKWSGSSCTSPTQTLESVIFQKALLPSTGEWCTFLDKDTAWKSTHFLHSIPLGIIWSRDHTQLPESLAYLQVSGYVSDESSEAAFI